MPYPCLLPCHISKIQSTATDTNKNSSGHCGGGLEECGVFPSQEQRARLSHPRHHCRRAMSGAGREVRESGFEERETTATWTRAQPSLLRGASSVSISAGETQTGSIPSCKLMKDNPPGGLRRVGFSGIDASRQVLLAA
ncbi:unnamed protein product [Pleuronectes platessa]|uniref:Uncharacterized protein n=1 Tax=Pleuronectes platessa TaxID=8262 RepID=A0A9N7VZY1_PLEPL|nr:unnamed protein product [Pleuronectes platessa]